MLSPALTAQLARLHAAIVGTAPGTQEAQEGAAKSIAVSEPLPTIAEVLRATQRPQDVPAAHIILPAPEPMPLAEVADLEALPAGPRRLLETLHDLAVTLNRLAHRALVPSQQVIHQSQELLAAAFEVNPVTIRRWTADLKKLGYIDSRPHKATTYHRASAVTRNTGLLFAVRLRPGHRARLRFEDLKYQWRDLDADRKTGNTAWKALSGAVSGSSPSTRGEWLERLKTWAVNPGKIKNPLQEIDCDTAPGTVQHVIHALPLVGTAHPTKRAALVGTLAAGLAHALKDEGSHRWYCGLIWSAWRQECEGRPGLQALAAQLTRLDVDRREWVELRNPAALLVSRYQIRT